MQSVFLLIVVVPLIGFIFYQPLRSNAFENQKLFIHIFVYEYLAKQILFFNCMLSLQVLVLRFGKWASLICYAHTYHLQKSTTTSGVSQYFHCVAWQDRLGV